MRPLTTVFLSMLLCGPALSAERDRPFIDEAEPQTPESVEDRDTTWKEDSTSLPPWPKDEDLVEFSVDDPSSRFRQFIDGKHIQIGTDGAVRYTLVVESRSGARNVSYEGLRCTPSGALRIYAYGTNGRFVKIDGEWEPIQGRGDDKMHRDLHKLLLCIPRKFEPRPPKGIIRAMRAAVPSEASAGFVTD